MKLSHPLVLAPLAAFVLIACSSPAQRRQAKNDVEYLDSAPLKSWNSLPEASPSFYPDYQIPSGEFTGVLGLDLDIRPPQQILELIPNARLEEKNQAVTFWFQRQDDSDSVWQKMLTVLGKQKVTVQEQSDNQLVTDWVLWRFADEDTELSARYQMSRYSANKRFAIQIEMIEWRQDQQVQPPSHLQQNRYTAYMTNLITTGFDHELKLEQMALAEQQLKQIQVSMGTDRSGLPVIIARAPYDALWLRLPGLLKQMGFKLSERNQSQGTIEAKFSQSSHRWTELGVEPTTLASGSYTLLFGDLVNRTSMNLLDDAGQPISDKQLQEIAPILSAVAAKSAVIAKE